MTEDDEPTGPDGSPDPEPKSESKPESKPAEPEPGEPDAAKSKPPARKPRPTSATSRARRIGGGAAPTGPSGRGADTGKGAEASEGTGSGDDTPTIKISKSGGKPGGRTGKTGSTAASKKSDRAKSAARADSDTGKDAEGKAAVTLPGWVRWIPAAALLAAAVTVLAFFVADHVSASGDSPGVSQKERQTVLAAAKTCVATMNTYKYTELDAYEKAGVGCTTGELTKEFRKTVDTLIRKAAPTQKFTQVAQINQAGIESVSKNGKQWSVLLYGQLNITNKGTGKQGRVDPFSVVATMQKVGGKWVIGKVQLLASVGG